MSTTMSSSLNSSRCPLVSSRRECRSLFLSCVVLRAGTAFSFWQYYSPGTRKCSASALGTILLSTSTWDYPCGLWQALTIDVTYPTPPTSLLFACLLPFPTSLRSKPLIAVMCLRGSVCLQLPGTRGPREVQAHDHVPCQVP